ncbi:hypothetical protein LUZ60_011059 [Juncus effusus]|nr:hypothetical protein LUZ60_011059 [Juncus effusus]
MSRIHPTETRNSNPTELSCTANCHEPSILTVWKKSSMSFQGMDGFSVYDNKGILIYRVDNYSRRHKCFTGEITLMDGKGRAILSLKPQKLSMHDQWNAYKSEEITKKGSRAPIFSMKRCAILQNTDAAEVFMTGVKPSFRIDGCFMKRCCRITDINGKEIAKISRKKTGDAGSVMLSDDVFSLIVQPGVDCEIVMAFVIIMDRICHKSFTPIMCS